MKSIIGPVAGITNSPNYKWWAYAALSVGLFLTVMDQSGVNIALPRIAEHFSANIPSVQWITLGYVLGTSAMLMPMGRLSDILSRKTVYMGGFVVFVVFAVVAGFSQSLPMLLAAKVLQGVGSAGIQANGMAMVAEVFPERERGKALGLYMTIIGTGSITGPIIGGLLVSNFGWRWVFFASVPVGLLAFALALLILKGKSSSSVRAAYRPRFDWWGAILSSGALVIFLVGMTNAHGLGWTSPVIITAVTLSIGLLATFLWWELRTSDPMLDLSFFRSRVFSGGVAARFLSFLGGSSVFFLMPFYLVQGLGYPASRAALILVPGSIGMAVIGPISGRLSDVIGTRWLTVGGLLFSGTAMLIFSRLSVDSPPSHVTVGMICSGVGMGMFSSPNTSAIMSSIDRERYGIVSAFLNLTRTSANVTGIAIATTIVTFTMGAMGFEPNLSALIGPDGEGARFAFVQGLNKAFLISAGLIFTALVISAIRGESDSRTTPSAMNPGTHDVSTSRSADDD